MNAAVLQMVDAPAPPPAPVQRLAPVALLPWEETEGYTALHQALVAHHAPEGPVEEHLVEEIAGILWRKRRLYAAQAAVFRHRYAGFHGNAYAAGEIIRDAVLPHAPAQVTDRPSTALAEIVAEVPGGQESARAFDRDCGRIQAALGELRRGATLGEALERLPERVRTQWQVTDTDSYPDSVEGLVDFLEQAALPALQQEALARRHAGDVKAQLIGQTLDVQRMESLDRHETHLDRKFERTLAMLVKLQELRLGSRACDPRG
jgi:hypothetical protein